MHRARRVALIAVFAIVGGVALTGCRSQPGVAAYVGDVKIMEREVASLATDARDRAAEANEANGSAGATAGQQSEPAAGPVGTPARDDIAATLVMREVARQVASRHGLNAIPIDRARMANAAGVAESSEYAKVLAETTGYLQALRQAYTDEVNSGRREPVAPTEEQIRRAYDRAVAARAVPPGQLAGFAQQLLQVDAFQLTVGVAADLATAARQARVAVNPRYRPLEYKLLTLSTGAGQFVALAVPLAGDPAASASAGQP